MRPANARKPCGTAGRPRAGPIHQSIKQGKTRTPRPARRNPGGFRALELPDKSEVNAIGHSVGGAFLPRPSPPLPSADAYPSHRVSPASQRADQVRHDAGAARATGRSSMRRRVLPRPSPPLSSPVCLRLTHSIVAAHVAAHVAAQDTTRRGLAAHQAGHGEDVKR